MIWRVDNFKVEITDPHPCWITIEAFGGDQIRISHAELRDLEYVVTKAIREVEGKLGHKLP